MEILSRREFSQRIFAYTQALVLTASGASYATAASPEIGLSSSDINLLIDANRPGARAVPPDFDVGIAHVRGGYSFTKKPFLVEGAKKIHSLGTRTAKFWLMPKSVAKDYRPRSNWQGADELSLAQLVEHEYFQQALALPFTTIVLETRSAPEEQSWQTHNFQPSYYRSISFEYYQLARSLYKTYRKVPKTFILQNWEGDHDLRGAVNERWEIVPADAEERCNKMQQVLKSRQQGVEKARGEFGRNSLCAVLNAIEVNNVVDALTDSVPTVTNQVLPFTRSDLVSYSSYDSLSDPELFFRALRKIREKATKEIYIGELGIPEYAEPDDISQRLDRLFGAAIAAGVRRILIWQLYDNEGSGFGLIRRDGTASETLSYIEQFL